MSLRSKVVAAAVVTAAVVACGGREPPPKPPPAPSAPNDPHWLEGASAACAKIASCTHMHDAPHLRDPGACVDWWIAEGEPRTQTALAKCLGVAKTCAAVNTCLHGRGDARAAAFCAERPGVVSGCDGDRLVSCGDDVAQESNVVDCAKMGATCREAKSSGGLVIRACFSPEKCPPSAPEARCEGNTAISCRDGALETNVCGPGTQCRERHQEGGEAVASCELPGDRRCDRLGTRRCEDDRLVECERGATSGNVKVSDCVGVGLHCLGTGPRAGCYVPVDVECDRELLPRCDGGRLVFCAAGRLTKISCASLGLGTCNPSARGPMAACEDVAQGAAAATPAPPASSALPASSAK